MLEVREDVAMDWGREITSPIPYIEVFVGFTSLEDVIPWGDTFGNGNPPTELVGVGVLSETQDHELEEIGIVTEKSRVISTDLRSLL